jgi:alanine dehydrogenase
MVLALSASEVETLLDPVECFPAIERVYRDLGQDRAVNRPRSHTFMPVEGRDDGARFLFKTIEGGSASLGVYILRLNSELWVPPSKEKPWIRKVPTTEDGRFTEFMLMFSARDGRLMALFPDGQIQKTRVALTHALAAKYLARADAKVLGLYGSGWQAGAQAEILAATRKLERIQLFSPNPAHREAFAERLSARLDCEIRVAESPDRVMEGADIVIGATNATSTVIRAAGLARGMHVSSVRSRAEIEPAILSRADRIVVHNRTESFDHWCGDMPPGIVDQKPLGIDRKDFPQLSDIVGGGQKGRMSADDITVFVDGDRAGGPGIGIQFAAVCFTLYEKAMALKAKGRSVGQELAPDWFLDREDHPART